MGSNKGFFARTVSSLWHAIKKGWLVMLLSLVIAVLFWGYVMAGLNPTRPKTVSGIPISITGTQDLLSRNLIIVSGDSETATAVISAEITKHAALNAGRVDCSVSVNTITKAGIYTLPVEVNVQSALGKYVSVAPASVTIVVDDLIDVDVPVQLRTVGTLPDSYGVYDSTLSRNLVNVRGARRYIEPIARAEAVVNISDRTEPFSGTVPLVFYNAANEEIKVETVTKQAPSVIANIKISAFTELPIHVNALLPDPEQYDTDTTLSAKTVCVWGDPEDLRLLTQVETENLVITPDMVYKSISVALITPTNTIIKPVQIKLAVQVSEHIYNKNFEVEVVLHNVGRSLIADDFTGTIVVCVTGTKAQLDGLDAEDIVAFIDATGLAAGVYELSVNVELPKRYRELSFTVTPEELSLTLRLK